MCVPVYLYVHEHAQVEMCDPLLKTWIYGIVDYMNARPSAALCHVLTVIDGETEGLLDVIEIRNFELLSFRQQFDVCPESDPEMRNRYGIGPDDATFVNIALGRVIPFDFTHYAYFIEAVEKH